MGALLAIDTAGEYASISVLSNNIITTVLSDSVESHIEDISGITIDVLSKAGTKLENIENILFGNGPGSFTGLRIGASFVAGLSIARTIPIFSLDSFSALAYVSEYADRVVVTSDARRGEFYCAIIEKVPIYKMLKSPCVVTQSELEELSNSYKGTTYLRLGQGDTLPASEGLCRLYMSFPAVFTPTKGSDIALNYVRPVSARTIKERTSGLDQA